MIPDPRSFDASDEERTVSPEHIAELAQIQESLGLYIEQFEAEREELHHRMGYLLAARLEQERLEA